MNELHPLLHRVGALQGRAGGFDPHGGAWVRGQPLHDELAQARWFELYLFALTGRRYDGPRAELLETLWTYTSYPDARLWNNRVAALGGSQRSSAALSLGAAVAVSDAQIYGLGPCLAAWDLFECCLPLADDPMALEREVVQRLRVRRALGGYGRPIVASDERIAPLMAKAQLLGIATGQNVELAFAIDRLLRAGRWRMNMNYAALVAAWCRDLGLDRLEYQGFVAPIFLAGMPAVYAEAAREPISTLFPLPVAALNYDGPAPRHWPGQP